MFLWLGKQYDALCMFTCLKSVGISLDYINMLFRKQKYVKVLNHERCECSVNLCSAFLLDIPFSASTFELGVVFFVFSRSLLFKGIMF